jgi:hypothetical protein
MRSFSWFTQITLLVLPALFLPLRAAQDSMAAAKKITVGVSAPTRATAATADSGSAVAKPVAAPENTVPGQPLIDTSETSGAPTPASSRAAHGGAGVEKLRADAGRLKAEARALRDLADTLNRSSDDAEKRAVEAQQKAEKLGEEIGVQDMRHAAGHVRMEIERIKRLIQADVERIKRAHGVKAADDSLYELQADSLDTVLARMSGDTSQNLEQQKKLVEEIQENSKELLEKSREMSAKARELEETAGKREDLAEDLFEKADRLAEDQNTLPLSKRFPLHFGFQLRITDVGPYNQQKLDLLLLHGMFLTYSLTKNVDAGIQDITLYWQDTPDGERYAITGSPSVRLAFFPVKRLQLGAVAGAEVQGRVGAKRSASASVAPFVALFNEVWVRNHFSISPILRLNYAAYGPLYTAALSQHSGVLPQGALWLDVGMGYTFNF